MRREKMKRKRLPVVCLPLVATQYNRMPVADVADVSCNDGCGRERKKGTIGDVRNETWTWPETPAMNLTKLLGPVGTRTYSVKYGRR